MYFADGYMQAISCHAKLLQASNRMTVRHTGIPASNDLFNSVKSLLRTSECMDILCSRAAEMIFCAKKVAAITGPAVSFESGESYY